MRPAPARANQEVLPIVPSSWSKSEPYSPNPGAATVRVLVVDDSAFMRKVVSSILASAPGIEVVATARDGEGAGTTAGRDHSGSGDAAHGRHGISGGADAPASHARRDGLQPDLGRRGQDHRLPAAGRGGFCLQALRGYQPEYGNGRGGAYCQDARSSQGAPVRPGRARRA